MARVEECIVAGVYRASDGQRIDELKLAPSGLDDAVRLLSRAESYRLSMYVRALRTGPTMEAGWYIMDDSGARWTPYEYAFGTAPSFTPRWELLRLPTETPEGNGDQ